MKKQFSIFSQVLRRCIIVIGYILFSGIFLYSPIWLSYFWQNETLNVCIFAETITYEAIERFQKKTGIKVNLTYAEIDDQTYAKFRINQGQDYDVINLSDAFVHILSNQDMLHKIDHNKIPNIKRLYENLLNHTYDEGNQYSIPHKWYVYGIVYDRAFFNIPPSEMSLDYIFTDPQKFYLDGHIHSPYRLCMIDDARDGTLLTSLHLFKDVSYFDQERLNRILQLLIQQKHWVEAYTMYSSQYFLFSDIVPIALMTSNYMRKIYKYTNRFDFAIPKEGSILIIENLVIPKKSKRVDSAHQFINFMIEDEMARFNSKAFGYNSSNKYANNLVDKNILLNPHIFPTSEMFKKLHIPLIPSDIRKIIDNIWLTVGFS